MDLAYINESFNARYLSYREVATGFVVNQQFGELISPHHSLIMGPRGSGKTTLLKMLTPVVLSERIHEIKGHNHLPFVGVYIPTDVDWNRKYKALNKEITNKVPLINSLSRSIITCSVMLSLMEAFLFQMSTFPIDKNERLEHEVTLCKALSQAWYLKTDYRFTLVALEKAVLERVTEINIFIEKLRYYTSIGESRQLDPEDYVFINYFDVVRSGIQAFEMAFQGYHSSEQRWALCFDELEIAPKWLQHELVEFLRSRDQKIILKLTTSPVVSLYELVGEDMRTIVAGERQDYEIIRIWTYEKIGFHEWSKFCNKLVEKRYGKRLSNNPMSSIIGESSFDISILSIMYGEARKRAEGVKAYDKGSPSWWLFREYARKNSGFKDYLIKQGVDPDNPVPKHKSQRSAVFRKVKPLVLLRYLNNSKLRVKPVYYGVPLIYDMCDGNPRVLITLLESMISEWERRKGEEVALQTQSRIIEDISNSFVQLYSNHPDATIRIGVRSINLGVLLDTIGDYFRGKVYSSGTWDIPTKFYVDDKVDKRIVDLLKLALDLGAIVYVDPTEGLSESGLYGKEFRLSYLISPRYGLPLRMLKSINLSTIVGQGGNWTPTLFD